MWSGDEISLCPTLLHFLRNNDPRIVHYPWRQFYKQILIPIGGWKIPIGSVCTQKLYHLQESPMKLINWKCYSSKKREPPINIAVNRNCRSTWMYSNYIIDTRSRRLFVKSDRLNGVIVFPIFHKVTDTIHSGGMTISILSSELSVFWEQRVHPLPM